MSAGTGVTHSEFNPSAEEGARFLQIWIVPEKTGLTPSYDQKTFSLSERTDVLRLVVDPDGKDGAVTVHQDARIYASTLTAGADVSYDIPANRHVWIQIIGGVVGLEGDELRAGDGVALSDVSSVTLSSQIGAEVLLFDLA